MRYTLSIALLCTAVFTIVTASGYYCPIESNMCFTCSQVVQPEVEIIVKECGPHNDTDIQCKAGYYRRKARNGRVKDRCELCSVCDHVTLPCRNYTDAICCHPNEDAVQNSDGVFYCKERPILCKPGQFFNSKTEKCLPCPPDTYMLDKGHNHGSCWKCAVLSHSSTFNSKILQNCSSESPTLFGCKEGYYRTIHEMATHVEVMCTECNQCIDTGILRNCSHMHDSVCKPNPETVTTSTAGTSRNGGHCVNVSTSLLIVFGGCTFAVIKIRSIW